MSPPQSLMSTKRLKAPGFAEVGMLVSTSSTRWVLILRGKLKNTASNLPIAGDDHSKTEGAFQGGSGGKIGGEISRLSLVRLSPNQNYSYDAILVIVSLLILSYS